MRFLHHRYIGSAMGHIGHRASGQSQARRSVNCALLGMGMCTCTIGIILSVADKLGIISYLVRILYNTFYITSN